MKSELMSFHTKDKLELPGLLYEPARKSNKVAIFLHGNGNGSVFNNPVLQNTIGDALTKKGIAYFPFNNRGSGYIRSFKKMVDGKKVRRNLGMAFELIKDCVIDIDAALAALRKRGYSEFYLLGVSTGANKICVYNYYKPKNIFSKFILLAPGDDVGGYLDMWGPQKFGAMLKMSKDKIKAGKGDELVPQNLSSYNFISFKSLYDMINPDGNYNVFPYFEVLHNLDLTKKKKIWREYRSLKKPTLVLMPGRDEYCYGKIKEVVKMLKGNGSATNFNFKILPGSLHGFWKKEKELAKILADWIFG
ncbi:MAG: DUF1749 domain-containing protein [Candidatus Pacebacteria bacterium]|nr:DUF1749 domain-containing protein [Candidatus Paceibacterota bacterium]MDD5356911.1 DUF1749 domain-containing protein [Candidatus Paceibacterota bacterium]